MRFDQVQDQSGRELYAFVHDIAVPDFVKTATQDTEESVRWMDDGAFADRIKRAFPINTPARTWLSHVFYINKRAQLERRVGKLYADTIGQNIQKAAEAFGITDTLAAYAGTLNVKQAATEGPAPVSTVDVGGVSYEVFPVKTAEDFCEALGVFAHTINKFPFEQRQKIAADFLAGADRFGIDEIPSSIAKYAGLYYADVVNLPDILAHRMSKIADENLAAEYAKLVEKSAAVRSNDEAFSLVTEAAVIERKAGLEANTKVAAEIGDIVDRVFSLSVEKVAELLDCVEMGGELFNVNQLQKISADIYKQAFGLDIDPSDTGALRDILPTMPRSDVALFKELSGTAPL